jgi:hypothetical protein
MHMGVHEHTHAYTYTIHTVCPFLHPVSPRLGTAKNAKYRNCSPWIDKSGNVKTFLLKTLNTGQKKSQAVTGNSSHTYKKQKLLHIMQYGERRKLVLSTVITVEEN